MHGGKIKHVKIKHRIQMRPAKITVRLKKVFWPKKNKCKLGGCVSINALHRTALFFQKQQQID